MRRVPPFLVVLILSSQPSSVRAQSTNGSISGRVTDPSHAVIANANVAAVNAGTNFRYETSTTNSGEYYLTNLRPGSYRLEVEKSGFKKLLQPDVVLHVQDSLAIDFEMTLGPSKESITVEAGAPLVNTSDATVSTLINRTFVEDIPLNGRSFQTLIMLTPGVVVTATAFDDQGQFSVNGQRADANYFTVDGVSANFGVTGYTALVQTGSGALPALSVAGGFNSLVSVDAMQEFRIQTSSFAPEFGRMPAGQISIVTRSGTNQFHGTAFEYFRNDVLDANDWFVNFNHLKKPATRQNDFGGVFGGPVFKNKTFFFFSYEGLRLRQPEAQETVVPDAASRPAAPATMQPFLNAYPVANGTELGASLAQFNSSYSNPSSLDAYSIRVDHAINSNLTLFGRYNYSPSSFDQRGPFSAPFTVLSTRALVDSTVHTMTLGLTKLITPGISNEVRANYSNQRVTTRYILDNFGGAVPIPDSLLFPSEFSSENGVFELIVLGAGIVQKGRLLTSEQRQFNVTDNLSVTKGRHQMKFGVDYRWLSPFVSPLAYGQIAEFIGVTANPGGALSGTAALAAALTRQENALLSQNFSFYGQDTWKITPRFTVTYGLRWDINPALKGKNSANDPFTVTGLNDPATLALAPRGTPLYQTTYGNVAPRVGVAYQLREGSKEGTVLRAGFGTFYDLGQGSLGAVSSFFPYNVQKNIFLAPFPLSPENAAPPTLSTSPPLTVALNVADPHLKLPRTYQWNFALEQSLGGNQSLSFTYIGSLGRDLLRVTNLTNPNADFPFVGITSNTARSYYNALQVKFQRRYSRGLQALASYTFSRSIDNASTDAYANYLNTPGGGSYQSTDRGDSDFDIRHSFTAGVTYSIPTPGWNGFARGALGGWSVDTFILARSGPPDNIVGSIYFASGTALASRPNLIPGVPLELFGPQYPGGKIFNNTTPTAAQVAAAGCIPTGAAKGAFCTPPKGTQGNFGRNVLRGFGTTQFDLGVQRQFSITERVALRFRAELFNIFNHPNFGNPNNTLSDPLFGHSTQTLANSLGSGGSNGGFSPLYQIGGPRSIQLALKLAF